MSDVYAVCDFGSNSARLMISRVENQKLITLERRVDTIRIGSGVQNTGSITIFELAAQIINEYKKQAAMANVKNFFVFATSAVRDAKNRYDFISYINEHCGVHVDVLSGDEEALFGFLGATMGGSSGSQIGLIDIGGGSSEIVISSGNGIDYSKSYQIGAVRAMNQYARQGYQRTYDEIIKMIKPPAMLQPRRAGKTVPIKFYAIGGSAVSLGAIALNIKEYTYDCVHGYELSFDKLSELIEMLNSMTVEERRQIPSLDVRRADVIVYGGLILKAIMNNFSLKSVILSEKDNLDGYLLMRLNL